MQKELISFIIPIYNVEKYLEKCLNSVIDQTYKNIEIICIDDGSTDSCASIVNEFASKDSRIKVLIQKNQGVSVARNNGFNISKGSYIIFADADDYIHPQLAEISAHYLRKYSADMVTYDYTEVKLNDNNTLDINLVDDIDNIDCTVTNTPLYHLYKQGNTYISFHSCRLCKRELLKNIEYIPNIYYEDIIYTLDMLNTNPKTVMLNIPLYAYIKRNSSITGVPHTIKHLTDRHNCIQRIHAMYKDTEHYEFACNKIISMLIKQQYNNIRGASVSNKSQLWSTFATQLKELDALDLLRRKDHKLTRYIRYKFLILFFAGKN